MNKVTSTLAGLALVAGASIAPAFAQGAFSNTTPFTFAFTPTSFSVNNALVNYNPVGGGAASTGFLTLTGGTKVDSSSFYQNINLSFATTSGGTPAFTDVIGAANVPFNPIAGNYDINSINASAKGDQFNLSNGSPVPEASTVLSFGALLALGGLAVLRRKTVVNNAA